MIHTRLVSNQSSDDVLAWSLYVSNNLLSLLAECLLPDYLSALKRRFKHFKKDSYISWLRCLLWSNWACLTAADFRGVLRACQLLRALEGSSLNHTIIFHRYFSHPKKQTFLEGWLDDSMQPCGQSKEAVSLKIVEAFELPFVRVCR